MKLEHYKDGRGIIMFASPIILDFDYKYLTIGTIVPGEIRGGHYHKRTYEKILCITGTFTLVLCKGNEEIRKSLSEGDVEDIPLSYTHYVCNEGTEVASFVEFKSEEYDKGDNDTFK